MPWCQKISRCSYHFEIQCKSFTLKKCTFSSLVIFNLILKRELRHLRCIYCNVKKLMKRALVWCYVCAFFNGVISPSIVSFRRTRAWEKLQKCLDLDIESYMLKTLIHRHEKDWCNIEDLEHLHIFKNMYTSSVACY